jgi:hypothetical protein
VATTSQPNRRLLIAVDMERYSRQDNVVQYRSQRTFQQVMHEAVRELGLDRVRWITQQGGDGELAILPPDTPETVVVGTLAPVVNRLLATANQNQAPPARVRLRMAVHQGLVHLDGANGYPGEAVVTVCRLVDAPPLKAALRAFPSANVALIVSSEIYRDVVRQYGEPRPDRFREVKVRMPDKEFEHDAWVHVPDEDVTHGDPMSDGEAGQDPAPPVTGTAYHARDVTGHNVAFGNSNTFNA